MYSTSTLAKDAFEATITAVDYDFNTTAGPDVTFTFQTDSQETITRRFQTEEYALGDDLQCFVEMLFESDPFEFFDYMDKDKGSFDLDRLVGRTCILDG